MLTVDDRSLLVRQHPYFSRIYNIVFGDDPRQGYMEKNTFYHPRLRFFFSFPEEWKLKNTPSQVVMSSKDGNAAVVLRAEKSTQSLSNYAQEKAASIKGGESIGEESLTINSLAAHQILLDVSQEEEEDLRIRLTCIKKGPYIFSFTALSTLIDFRRFEPLFQSIVQSFDELRDKTRLNRKPKRLKLIRASGRENLRQIFEKAGMEKELWPKTAILNGIELDQTPRPQQPLKIIK
jgi:predicted Zn-dependent protease